MNTNNINVGQTLYIKGSFAKCTVLGVYNKEIVTHCIAGTIVSWEKMCTVKVKGRKKVVNAKELCTKKEALKMLKIDVKYFTRELKYMTDAYKKANKALEKFLDAE